MTHKLSFIVLGGSGSRIRQFHLSKQQFIVIAAVIFIIFAALAFGAADYLAMRNKLMDKHAMELELAAQSEEVLMQRRQIQNFAIEINQLKENLLTLNQFQNQIRVMANIDQPDSHDGMFGIGGSAPEDLIPDLDLNHSHVPLMKQMHQQINQLGDVSQKQEITFTHLLDKLEEQKNVLAHTPAIRPAQGWTTSTFSYRQSPFTGNREFHKGIDIANQHGTSIVATADGVVSFCGDIGSLGRVIVIDHGYGIVTRFAHIDEELKQRGDQVKRGELIAKMGNTGRSTGPHLHYEVRLNGVPVNPEKYILN